MGSSWISGYCNICSRKRNVTSSVKWTFSTDAALSTSTTSVTFTATYEWNNGSVTATKTQNVTVTNLSSPYTLNPGINGFGDSEKSTWAGWTNGEQTTEVYLDNMTFTATGGGNDGKYYATDKTWRFYESGNGAITIETDPLHKLSSVTFTYAKTNNGALFDE